MLPLLTARREGAYNQLYQVYPKSRGKKSAQIICKNLVQQQAPHHGPNLDGRRARRTAVSVMYHTYPAVPDVSKLA